MTHGSFASLIRARYLRAWIFAATSLCLGHSEAISADFPQVSGVISPFGPKNAEQVESTPMLQWEDMGPAPVINQSVQYGGAVLDIAVHPAKPGTVYITASTGGVWRTTDAGSHWVPLTGRLPTLVGGAVAVTGGLAGPDRIYYMTGQQTCGQCGAGSWPGDGLYVSTNSGSSWTKRANSSDVGIGSWRMILRPGATANNDTLFIASDIGLLRSLNGGSTWNVVLSAGGPADGRPDRICTDVVMDPNRTNIFYAALWRGKIYKSTAYGALGTWNRLLNGLPDSTATRGQAALAIGASNPNVLLASIEMVSTSAQASYKSIDDGASWAVVATPLHPPENYLAYGPGRRNCAAIDPNDANILFLGGLPILRSTNGGANWDQIFDPPVHVDQWRLTWGGDHVLWSANDGGVYKSSNSGATWTDVNTDLGAIQFYSVAVHPASPTSPLRVIGGNQDNGSVRYDGGKTWTMIDGGDGGISAAEWANDSYYNTTDFPCDPLNGWDATIYRSSNCNPGNSQGDAVDTYNAAFMPDPYQPLTLYYGTQRLWKTINSGAISPTWAVVNVSPPSLTNGGVICGLSVTKSGAMYTSSGDGRVMFSNNGMTWLDRSAGLPPGAFMPDIAADPDSSQRAYVAIRVAPGDGYRRTSGPRVFATTDHGSHWQNITGDLPVGPMAMCLAVDFRPVPRRLYLGTSLGVFTSEDEGAHWRNETGLPNVIVYQLLLDTRGDYLYAATLGRGMWRAPVPVRSVYCRINCGGSSVASTDGGPAWSEDTYANPSPYVNSVATGNATGGTGSTIDMSSPTLPAGVPMALFQDERWDPPGDAELQWTVPAPIGHADVRLYFAEIYTAITGPGQRLFDVDINGVQALTNFDIWSQAGLNKGYMLKFEVTSPSTTMTIGFQHKTENPFISAIEVLSANDGITAVTPTPASASLLRRIVPNPFLGETTIGFALKARAYAHLSIYDVSGHLVATLADEEFPAGEHAVSWNGRDRSGRAVGAGVYFCRFNSGSVSEARRLVRLR